jgi:hypothetical protein
MYHVTEFDVIPGRLANQPAPQDRGTNRAHRYYLPGPARQPLETAQDG